MILGVSAALTCLGFVFGACGIAHAEEDSAIRTLLNDTGQYFSTPLRWDLEEWTYFGLSGAAVAAAHEFDSKVRSHFARGSNAVLDGKNRHSLRDAFPALALIAGTWATAGYLGDDDGYRETWRLVEAGAFSSVTATALGLAAGRKRPDATISPNQWRKGGDSFPSVHVSAAFAIGGTFAESGNDDYRWIRRIVGYGLATGTAYIRVKDNVHWASDTVAGAVLGLATARFVVNRENGTHAEVAFQPQRDGWMVSYTVPLH